MKHWPEHIIGLAKEILEGKKVEPFLADALEEFGCPILAAHFRPSKRSHAMWFHKVGAGGSNCTVACVIVGNTPPDLPDEWINEHGKELGIS